MNYFLGTHILCEFYGVDSLLLNDTKFMSDIIYEAIKQANLTCIGSSSKQFEPQGITMIFLLSESHISLHTYPEYNSMFFDVFTCGNGSPDKVVEVIKKHLNPNYCNMQKIQRGHELKKDG